MTIYRLNSDLEDLENFWKSLRLRKMEQKFLYMWDGASNYYNDGNVFEVDAWVSDQIKEHTKNFWVDIFKWIPLNKQTLISLWSWAWNMEKLILNELWEGLDFFAVDSSDEMLWLLEENYKNVPNTKVLMRADITSCEFLREIKDKTKKYSKKVFTFLWNTVGNIENTSIVDTIYWLLDTWDQMWLDVRLLLVLKPTYSS